MKLNSFAARQGRVFLCGAMVFAVATSAPVMVQAAPKAAPRLEIWPGQRVLLVLPLSVSGDWNQSNDLGNAIIPLVRPELQKALEKTGKFSVTLPYKFDPILRRAVVEKTLSDADINAFIEAPSLDSSAPILANVRFEQPVMAAAVTLDELRVGGTTQAPTVQLKVSGRLYQGSEGAPFRSASITSRPVGGKTPEARISAAAAQALSELAQAFVVPPESFTLPLPSLPAPTTTVPTTPVTSVPVTPTLPAVPTPMTPNPSGEGALVPILPATGAPLGVDAPQNN